MPQVHLALGPADQAHRLALELVHGLTGQDDTRLVHACPRCGSSQHGRPVLTGPARGVHVSLARDRDHRMTVVAVCPQAPVGVDLEARGVADFDGFDAVARHPREGGLDATRLWVRTEAVLKAHGVGLGVDPRTVRVDRSPVVVAGQVTQVLDVALEGDWLCSLAVLSTDEVHLHTSW
ncbi:4'-phosphopantetheinyl transferase family protein [Luteococcus sp. OSA5]|uniref:4'-phosphopantetheinyl transferase family protein n=1 Tax=Luteococcus sp. OSA5 TaxID=3401630 RepID=UPI003B42BDEC